ncbi:MAG TPA: hypothetical protein VK021_05345 [Flavobacteriaceae bacterium]|nr:hypothetical protein [Flavobacteriaceae bacterium]
MRYFILIFAVLIWSGAFAQIDGPKKSRDTGKSIESESRSIGRESSSSQGNLRIDKGFSSSSKNKSLLGQPDSPSLKREKKDNKVNINQKEEYVKRYVDFKPKYAENEGNGEMYPEFSQPQDLGKFFTDGDYVKVSWRDAQVVDGDRVDIIVNGEVVVGNVTLLGRFHSIRVDLKDGFTKIQFKALNQGESGPNTAEFKVEDEDGSVLTHDEWNLTTGTVASLVVVKR